MSETSNSPAEAVLRTMQLLRSTQPNPKVVAVIEQIEAEATATLAAEREDVILNEEMEALNESEDLAYRIAVELSSPRLSPEQAIWPYGDQARRVADWLLGSDWLAARVADAAAAARAEVIEAVEASVACPHGPRHYYAIDATCQRCEMPSWVEALLRTTLTPPVAPGGAADGVEA